jgi:hypothetical protein
VLTVLRHTVPHCTVLCQAVLCYCRASHPAWTSAWPLPALCTCDQASGRCAKYFQPANQSTVVPGFALASDIGVGCQVQLLALSALAKAPVCVYCTYCRLLVLLAAGLIGWWQLHGCTCSLPQSGLWLLSGRYNCTQSFYLALAYWVAGSYCSKIAWLVWAHVFLPCGLGVGFVSWGGIGMTVAAALLSKKHLRQPSSARFKMSSTVRAGVKAKVRDAKVSWLWLCQAGQPICM